MTAGLSSIQQSCPGTSITSPYFTVSAFECSILSNGAKSQCKTVTNKLSFLSSLGKQSGILFSVQARAQPPFLGVRPSLLIDMSSIIFPQILFSCIVPWCNVRLFAIMVHTLTLWIAVFTLGLSAIPGLPGIGSCKHLYQFWWYVIASKLDKNQAKSKFMQTLVDKAMFCISN